MKLNVITTNDVYVQQKEVVTLCPVITLIVMVSVCNDKHFATVAHA